LVIPYSLYEQVKLIIQEFKGKVLDEDFGGDITISIQFQVEQFESFNARMIELSRGKIKAEIVESNPETKVPKVKIPAAANAIFFSFLIKKHLQSFVINN